MFLPDPRIAELARRRQQEGNPLVAIGVGMLLSMVLAGAVVAYVSL
jgi:hypothetical protein